ncbi:LutC/YkgG family protein [Leucothrix arctica]|uniref:LUD domain-containing protein n=1 Tax=Leucothrix arctica TaxID=1481894 RepID=A0A317C9B4_9GAMM|nr:LUD domain-containing protein [Leucothrix arctica]PWQ95146.1 hypothetical protein DKT75_12410 [Leucothrix arctica]
MNKQQEAISRQKIFDAIKQASPTAPANIDAIQKEALELLSLNEDARPAALHDDPSIALEMRVEKGLVIGTSCERIATLADLPNAVKTFFAKHKLPKVAKVQETEQLQSLDWNGIGINADIIEDDTVGVCLAEYGIAETGSFVVSSSKDMPILLNFLPLYLVVAAPKSKVLAFMDDYALIANDIAKQGTTPRNICIISGASGTTDIEGVLVQGAHGPEFLHLVIVDDL